MDNESIVYREAENCNLLRRGAEFGSEWMISVERLWPPRHQRLYCGARQDRCKRSGPGETPPQCHRCGPVAEFQPVWRQRLRPRWSRRLRGIRERLRMLRRPRSQPRRQATPHRTAFPELPDGQQRLIRAGLEALRDPDMNRRVHEHLEARGDSPRDLIAAALVAARFLREQNGLDRSPEQLLRDRGPSQSV